MSGTGNVGEVSLRLARSTGFTLSVDFGIPAAGGITVLFGPSGCGKTTVLRCVAGLERGEGVVRVGAHVWQDDSKGIFVPTYSRSLGYVFQEASLFEHLNVERNLHFGIDRAKTADGEKRLAEAVELLGIGHLLKRAVSELSGGERQRCAIARALALRPDILLMDEPLAALDWARKREILPWLEKLRDELRIPILYVTHSSDEMARLADRLVVMENGRIVAQGAIEEVLGNAGLPALGGEGRGVVLSGQVSRLSEAWGTAEVDVGEWQFEVPAGKLRWGSVARLRVLARDVSLVLEKPVGTSILNILPATVESLASPDPAMEKGEDAGAPFVYVGLECADKRLIARVTRRSVEELGIRPGLKLWAQVKSAAVIMS